MTANCERKAIRKNLNVLIECGGKYIFFNHQVLLCLHVFIYQEDINLTNTEFVFAGTCRGPCNRTLFSDYPVSSKYF